MQQAFLDCDKRTKGDTMPLKQQLTEDMKQAMRDRNSMKLNTIRFMMSEIKNWEIDNGETDDAGVQKLIAKQIKQMKDAITEFEKGGRTDIVAEEEQKVAILQSYLPAQLSEAELSGVIDEVIAATEPKAMGPVMQAVKAKVGNQADGAMIARLVKEKLA